MKFQYYNSLVIIALFLINSFDCDDNGLIIIPNGKYTKGYEFKIKNKKWYNFLFNICWNRLG